MFIIVVPGQIPKVWENIKYAISQTGDINKEDFPLYANRLLHALLSGRARCIVRMDDDRNLLAIGITRTIIDNITGKDIMFLECIYSFAKIPTSEWEDLYTLALKIAKKEKCTKMSAYTSNPKVFEILINLGFTEYYRYFTMEI